jgi:hypothetical protein
MSGKRFKNCRNSPTPILFALSMSGPLPLCGSKSDNVRRVGEQVRPFDGWAVLSKSHKPHYVKSRPTAGVGTAGARSEASAEGRQNLAGTFVPTLSEGDGERRGHPGQQGQHASRACQPHHLDGHRLPSLYRARILLSSNHLGQISCGGVGAQSHRAAQAASSRQTCDPRVCDAHFSEPNDHPPYIADR